MKGRKWNERYSPWISNNRFVLRGGLMCRASKGDLLGYSLSMSAKRFRWSAQACSGSNGFAVSWYLWQWNKNLYVAMFRAFLMVSPPPPLLLSWSFWYTIKIINRNHLGYFCLLTLYKDLCIRGSFPFIIRHWILFTSSIWLRWSSFRLSRRDN